MIIVSSPSFKEQIISALENYRGEAEFKHIDTQGIRIRFSCTMDNEDGAKLAKRIIKSTPQGSVMFFQVTYHEE